MMFVRIVKLAIDDLAYTPPETVIEILKMNPLVYVSRELQRLDHMYPSGVLKVKRLQDICDASRALIGNEPKDVMNELGQKYW